jgi:hypothetical protein
MSAGRGRFRLRWIVVLVLLVATGCVAGLSAPASGDDSSQGQVRVGHKGALRELPEFRTRSSRTFSEGRGMQVTRSYSEPVNFRSGGEWKAIDNDLVASPKSGYALENEANSYALSLPDALDGKPVEVREGDDFVRFSLDGADGAPSGGGVEARYVDALPGVDVAYEAKNDSVKESLVLPSPSAGDRFVFSLDLSNGLEARENGAGGINFVRDGEVRMSFAPPVMHDSAATQAVSRAASLELDGTKVVLRADDQWLRDKDREYPVVIDPTTNLTNTDDCYMVGGTQANTSFCGYTWNWLDIGKDGVGDPRRAFIQFDTSAIPSGAEVRASPARAAVAPAAAIDSPSAMITKPRR